MSRQPEVRRIGELQLRLLKELWARGSASVAEIHEALRAERRLAYTTIATMLRKMEVKGLVKHRSDFRKFVYWAMVREEAVSRRMTDDLLDRLYQGSLSNMVSHLLNNRDVTPEELAELEKLIHEKKKST